MERERPVENEEERAAPVLLSGICLFTLCWEEATTQGTVNYQPERMGRANMETGPGWAIKIIPHSESLCEEVDTHFFLIYHN